MKVSEYIKKGLKNFVEEIPENYSLLGEAQEKVHKIKFFVKSENNKIVDVKFNSSKRCKKLLAIADLVAEKLKGQELNNIHIDENEILDFFKEEKDKEKLIDRLNLIRKAIFS